jgi:hypothetical protein
MRKSHSTAVVIIIWLFIFVLAHPVSAHGDEPRLEISLERVSPGGVVDVRGVDFEPEEVISLSLVGEASEFALGDVVADPEGIFLQIVALPDDLASGAYHFSAVTDDHEITSPTLTVFGDGLAGEAEPVRDEDDPLLAPMPTYAPGVVPGGVSQPAASPENEDAPVSNAAPVLPIFVIGFLLLGTLALLRLWSARRL